MKKIFLSVAATILFAASSFASNATISNSETMISANKEKDDVKITLDLGKITNLTESELSKRVNEKLSILDKIDDELTCTVTVKGEIDLKVESASVEVSISGRCSEIRGKGKEIVEQLMEDMRDAVM